MAAMLSLEKIMKIIINNKITLKDMPLELSEKLKARMGNEYDSKLDSELRSVAATIGQAKEAHEIIESWTVSYTHLTLPTILLV